MVEMSVRALRSRNCGGDECNRGVAASMIARLKQLRNDFFSSVTTFRV